MPTFLPRRRALAGLLAAALAPHTARAQGRYPDKPVTLIGPNAAGGAADNLARAFAEELAPRLGQPVVVENVGGASGALGAQRVLRAAADGHTLLFGTTSDMVVTPIANRVAGYAPGDFTPIAKVGVTPMMLVARPGLGVSSVDQLVALARRQANALSVGTTGNASLQAFAAVSLQRAAGIDLLGVPYKGGAPLVNDLLAGQIDLAVTALPTVLAHVRAGKLVALGVGSDLRGAGAPEIAPGHAGGGVKGVAMEIGAGRAGPRGLPAPVLETVSRAVQALLTDKAFIERRARNGDTTPPFQPPAEFARFLAAEEQRFRALATGMKLE